MKKPLEGIRVIDMSTHGACPSCTKILANWGADVIKIESLKGDAGRIAGNTFGVQCSEDCNPHFDMLNAGKKSVAVNLKTPEGTEIMDRLLKTGNVFISNVRRASLERMGLGWDDFHRKYPGLVWAHLSGFGEDGPDAGKAGFDTVAYYARTGAMIDFSEKGQVPVTASFGVGDMSAGASLAGGIAAALLKQEKTGEGSKVTISLLGQSVWAHCCVLQGVFNGNEYPKTREAVTVPMNNSYQCSDGEWIYVSVLQFDRDFERFVKTIGRDDLLNDDRFNTDKAARKNNREFIKIIDEEMKKKTSDEWCELFLKADIAFDRIQHLKDVFTDPQVIENNMLFHQNYANGEETVIINPPVQINDYEQPEETFGPEIGRDTVKVLKGLGYQQEQIDSMLESGIIIG